jgi:WXG100 family type VII secretion target
LEEKMAENSGQTYQFNVAAYDQTKADFQQKLQAFEGVAQEINSQMSNLGQSWTGDASQAYSQVYSKWNQGYTDLNAVLASIKQSLEVAAQYLMETESSLQGSQQI